jgi:archaeosine-15-forming tRNA-guanine transglycosylase
MEIDETAEKAYKEKLRKVRAVIEKTKKLMASEKEEIQLKAIDLFLQLSELELALVQALSEEPETRVRIEEERNPLARRARLDR